MDEQRPSRVVGVGASAGGVDALTRVVRHLPRGLSAAVCIVLHVPATGRSLLAAILARNTDVEVEVAADGAPLRSVYVAPPDRHLVIEGDRLRLERGPKENGVRPAVDPMLRSLAPRLRRPCRRRDPLRRAPAAEIGAAISRLAMVIE